MLGEETRTLGDLPGDDGEKRINIPEAEVNHGELWSRSLHQIGEGELETAKGEGGLGGS